MRKKIGQLKLRSWKWSFYAVPAKRFTFKKDKTHLGSGGMVMIPGLAVFWISGCL